MVMTWTDRFLGGGYYACDNETLACLREDIDTQPHQFKSILMDDNFRKTFFPGIKKDEKKIVEAFCKMSADNALKKKPKVISEIPPSRITLLTNVGL
jgi:hypothetical protein